MRSVAAVLVSLALSSCAMMRGDAAPSTANVEVAPRPPAGVEAKLRSIGSAVTGKVRVLDRADGVTVLLSMINLPMGQYRIAFHERTNCSSPNGFSAGPAWAPASSGRDPHAIGPPLNTDQEGTAQASFFVRGVHTTGPDGVLGHSVLIYTGTRVVDPQPDVANNVVACGVFEPTQPLSL